MIRFFLAVAGLLLLAAPAAPRTAGSDAKAEVIRGVEARAKLSQVINDQLFSFAEIGFQERETERYLTALLTKEGFEVERNIAGLPTGWTARWTNGSGGPVIALGSDIDGIPKASQTPGIPWRQPKDQVRQCSECTVCNGATAKIPTHALASKLP